MKRILLAGILGGIAMYMWSSVAHVLTPLGSVGVSEIPNEAAVLSAMNTALGGNHGLYIFPGIGVPPGASREQQSAAMAGYEKKLQANPSGLLIYHPPGMKSFTPAQLITEFATELTEAILAVWLLSLTRITSFGGKVGFVALVGVLGSLLTNVSYWNWYGFPTNYTLTYMFVQIVGFVVVGIAAGLVTKNASGAARSATA